MGKSRKDRIKGGLKLATHQPLGDQITGDEYARTITRVKIRSEKKDAEFIDGTLGRTIVKQGLQQLQEIEKEKFEEEWPALGAERPEWRKKKAPEVFLTKKKKVSTESDEDESDDSSDDECKRPAPIGVDRIVADFEKELNINSADLEVLKHFTKPDSNEHQTRLADLFKDRITEKQSEILTQIDADSSCSLNLSPQIQEMCKDVGKVLANYRSGPLPKMFKVIPKMKAWEELVHLTNPEKWSAAAMYQATRIFVSNMKVPMAQRFFNLVLLPRVRDDISFYKRLNYHLYQALFKAMFKPAAFFKGILLPMCMSGNCTLREAIIVGSVVAKNHIPVMHTAAAMHKVAEMDYTGPNSIFMRIFFDKKYALPYRVVDACVYHFLKFEKDDRELPVLWHQSYLIFVQRYKEDLSQEQKEALMQLCKKHGHPRITAEIRRELQNSKCRQETAEPMAVD